jgi:4-methyl-5(b-hydroxyethyl)-thiazole monophosphate biosynthesis
MKKVLLLLPNGFETYEASVFIDVIGWNHSEGDGSTQLFSCGLHKEVTTSFNQKMVADYLVSEINVDDFDAIAIPGGFEEYDFYKEAYDERVLDLVRAFNSKGKIIASICVAALLVGKSGILNGKKGTTYNSSVRRETLRSYGVNVLDQPIVVEDNIITSSNPYSAVYVALTLLEMLTNKKNADYIRDIMGFKAE